MLWRDRDVVTQVSMTRPCPQGVLTWKEECDGGGEHRQLHPEGDPVLLQACTYLWG